MCGRATDTATETEACVGPRLPEPLLTAPGVAEDAELAEIVREVFDVGHAEIAAAVSRSLAAVRQIAHRARRRSARRAPVSPASPTSAARRK